jgi:HK97 gp10 family phage protein
MPRPRLRQSTNVRAKLSIDPKSLAEFQRAMKRLKQAVRREVVELALAAGGSVIHDAAEGKAPGPFIGLEIMTGSELMKGWKSAGAQGIVSNGIYAVIGPDDKHWYYRFSEYGVKAHGVKKRKRTKKEITLRAQSPRSMRRSIKKSFASRRPTMVFTINGKLIFARKVKGQVARPFLRPAMDSQGNAAVNKMGEVLGREIDKAARG